MSGKKSKKSKTFNNRSFGVFTNIAVGPLGFQAELDIDPKGGNPQPSRVVPRQRERDAEEPPVLGTSTAVAIHDTEHQDHPTRVTTDNMRWEGEPQMELEAPDQGSRDSGLGTPNTRTDLEEDNPKFGPLKSLLRAISIVYAGHEGNLTVETKIELLLSRVTSLEEALDAPSGTMQERRRQTVAMNELFNIEEKLRPLSEQLKSHADHSQLDEDVFGLLEDLRASIFHYQKTKLEERGFQLDEVESDTLNSLRCAQEAEYQHGDRDGCLKGTRRTILDEIEHWTCDPHRPPVYWLNGLAGTGKSTIAKTIAERAFADGRLGASFFCSRNVEDRSNLRSIFPTIATQLARRYTAFRSVFIPLARSDPGIIYEPLCSQMEKLIVGPLVKSAISTVIVIDALDECKDNEPASAILSVLGQFLNDIPKVKFFITARPVPRIKNGFRFALSTEATVVFALHEVEPGQVKSDIRLFYKHICSEIKSHLHGLDDWPTEGQLDLLCERAGGLFMYAVATARFIDQRNRKPERQLDRLIHSGGSELQGMAKLWENTTLDSAYMSILDEALGDNDPEDDLKARSVLGAVFLAPVPLSPSTIAALLGLDPGDVLPFLSSMHSVLLLPEDINLPVQPFHESFVDFIVNPSRCENPRFCIYPPHQHTELLVGCLDIMNLQLKRNMWKLPGVATRAGVKSLEQKPEQHFNKTLEYACRSWHKHLNGEILTQKPKIAPVLHRFLEEKFLLWLEALSVLGATGEAADALERAEKWCHGLSTLPEGTLL